MATTTYPLQYALVDSLKDHLQDKLIDNVPSGYETMLAYTDKNGVSRVLQASLVKIGRLQDDPTNLSGDSVIPSVRCSIHFHDPADTEGWKDGLCSAVESSMTNAAYRIPTPHEVGGGTLWWRRYSLEWEAFFIDADPDQESSMRLAACISGCLRHYTTSRTADNSHGWNCVLTDPLGETSVQCEVVKSHCWEGGGPPDDYIWRGKLWFQVLTGKE